jgi:hypothetical protein
MVILSGNRKETVLEIKLLRNYKIIEELRFVSDRNYNYLIVDGDFVNFNNTLYSEYTYVYDQAKKDVWIKRKMID